MSNDALSDVIDQLHADWQLSGQFIAGGKWSDRNASGNGINFYAPTKGSWWYAVPGLQDATEIETGDVLVINGNHVLILASDCSLIADAVPNPPSFDGQGIYRQGEGDEVHSLSGCIEIDAERQALLVSCLPPLIHVRSDVPEADSLAWLVGRLVKEASPKIRPGRTVAITALAQLLFVQTLRAYLTQAAPSDAGWLKVFRDRRLAAALGHMHHDPAQNWSLEDLANVAGMSRTSFAVQFREAMGLPPLAYLNQLRIRHAKRALLAGGLVGEVARNIGYASESAFSASFRRATGVSPGAFRRGAGAVGS